MAKQKVTVLIPAYNEEKSIKDIIKRSKPFCDDMLAVISKKSTDKTLDVVKSLGVKYLIDHGKGRGEAVRYAFSHIKEGIIVLIDADGSHIPEDIPKIIKPIKEGKADMVIASRFLGGSEELYGDFKEMIRVFFTLCISQIINWRFGTKIIDAQNAFRAIRADIIKKLDLKANRFDIEEEMVLKCFKNKYRVMEVPSMELKRKYGGSGITIWKDGWIFAWRVFRNLF